MEFEKVASPPTKFAMNSSMLGQISRSKIFEELHSSKQCFLIPNPWDAGSAKILTEFGFKALASTSAGFAFARGMADNTISREMLLAHLRELCAATDLPVSADLEGGFGSAPEIVEETILLAASCGIVGGSIEDSTNDPAKPLFDLKLSTERIRAAVHAARSLEFPFVLTARAENYFVGKPDIAETIKRLQAYEEAGADVLFAPGIKNKDEIDLVLREIKVPLNVIIGIDGMHLGFNQLKDMGVARVSVGGSLARCAIGALYRAATELFEKGTSDYSVEARSGKQLNELFSRSL